MRLPILFLVAMASVGQVRAQASLQDPTRPASSAAYVPAMAGAEPGQPGNQLQSVLIVPGRKPRALIDDQWVEQGQLFGDLRLVKVTGNSVILAAKAGGKGVARQEILLTPGIEITRPVKEKARRDVETK